MGDRCTNCGAPLASDQRYCVTCGERRGRARFAFDSMAAKPASAPPAGKRPPRRSWQNSSATLIAGVATLLLAMGVGVLIGEAGNNNNSTPRQIASTTPINIHVGGGSGTGTTGTSTSSSSSSKGGKSKKGKGASASTASKKAPISQATQQKAAAAAAKVTGGSAKVAAPTVQQGSKCTPGSAGCSGGTFSGNFFGGG